MKEHGKPIGKATANDLRSIGFVAESHKTKHLLNYYLSSEENDQIYVQVCLSNTDVIPVLIINQYDWDELDTNTTCTIIHGIDTLKALDKVIEVMRSIFI